VHADRKPRVRITDRIAKVGEGIVRYASPRNLGLAEGVVTAASGAVLHGDPATASLLLGGVMATHNYFYDRFRGNGERRNG
jgi:hypothetical protein